MSIIQKYKDFKLNKLIEDGKSKFKSGFINAAVEDFEKALKIEPENFIANYHLGEYYYKTRSYNKAKEHFEKLISHPECNHILYNYLGNIYRKLGLDLPAREAYNKALEIKPDFDLAWLNLGASMADKRLYDEEVREKIYHLLMNEKILFSEPPKNHKYKINTDTTQDWEQNVDYFINILNENPDYLDVQFLLSYALIKSRRLDEATEHLLEIIKQKPDWAEAHLNLGGIYADKGEYERALEHLRKAQNLKPDIFEIIINLARIHFKQGEKAKAVCMFLRSFNVEKQPTKNEKATDYLHRAMEYYNDKSYESARDELERCIVVSPHWPDLYYKLGLVYEADGKDFLAIPNFKKALEIKPGYKEVNEKILHYFNLYLKDAQDKERSGNFNEAIKSYEKLLTIDDKQKEIYMKLYKLCMTVGNSIKAKNALEQYKALS